MDDPVAPRPGTPPEDAWLAANREVATAMAVPIRLWSTSVTTEPVAFSGPLDAEMARNLLLTFGRDASPSVVDAFFARFTARFRIRDFARGLRLSDRAAQLLETYAFGRFVLMCARRQIAAGDVNGVAGVLDEIDLELWDAPGIIEFYETTSDARFPTEARSTFTATVLALRPLITRREGRTGRTRSSDTLAAVVTRAYAKAKKRAN